MKLTNCSQPTADKTTTPPKGDKDPTNPDYYRSYPVESIDMMLAIFGREAVRNFCLLSAYKYRMRLGKKDNTEQDLAKEKWYLDKFNELTKK